MPMFANVNGQWREIPSGATILGSVKHDLEQVWVSVGGTFRPIWITISYPIYQDQWVKVGGRSGGVPGTLWGSTHGYAAYNFKRYKTITAVQIRISIKKKQGSFHGSGGDWQAGGSPMTDPGNSIGYQWRAEGRTGEQVSPWLSCYVTPDQELRLFGKGNGDRGDGKTYNWMRIEGLQFA